MTGHGLSTQLTTDTGSPTANQSVNMREHLSFRGRSLPSPTQRRGTTGLELPALRPRRRPPQRGRERVPVSARAPLIGRTGGGRSQSGVASASPARPRASGGVGPEAGRPRPGAGSWGLRTPALRPWPPPGFPSRPPRTRPGLCAPCTRARGRCCCSSWPRCWAGAGSGASRSGASPPGPRPGPWWATSASCCCRLFSEGRAGRIAGREPQK